MLKFKRASSLSCKNKYIVCMLNRYGSNQFGLKEQKGIITGVCNTKQIVEPPVHSDKIIIHTVPADLQDILIHTWSDNPVTAFINIVKYYSNCENKLISYDDCYSLFLDLHYDNNGFDVNAHPYQFKLAYQGYEKTFDSDKSRGDKLYGAGVFTYTLYNCIQDNDMIYSGGKINIMEFEFVLYHLTKLVVKAGEINGVSRTYFTGTDNKRHTVPAEYKKYTGRKPNNHKLNHIIDVLQKYELINEKSIAVSRGKIQRQNYYTLGLANLFYGQKAEVKVVHDF